MLSFGYFGDGPWSHQALEALLQDQRFRLAFVVARRDRDEPTLRAFAETAGVPFWRPENVNDDDFLALVAPLAADIFVSMSYDQIFRGRLIRTPPLGVINCHAGALPRYRGRNVLNWALISGEDHFGVSVHYLDEGIDTGDLIRQQLVPIAPDDTYRDVLERAVSVCAQTLHTALGDVAEGRVVRTPQTGPGFYCGQRRDGDEWVDWTWTAARVHNFVRGIAPPAPGARSVVMTRAGPVQLALTRSALIPGAPSYLGTPGEVVGRSEAGIVVKTGDATLMILEVATIDASGLLGECRSPRYRVGTRFLPTPADVQLADLRRRLDDLTRSDLTRDDLNSASSTPEVSPRQRL